MWFHDVLRVCPKLQIGISQVTQEQIKYSASLGDRLVVGINSDKSVKKLKGLERPINSEEDRKFILESIEFVDEVIIFNEETPYELIKKIRPKVIVKGGDYNAQDVVGSDLCEVRIFDYVNGYSTTKTIQDISNR